MTGDYILKVGEQGKCRLELMSSFLDPLSQIFLNTIGIVEGMRVLEVGCGKGSMFAWLAEKVGRNGQVLALDSSQEQLDIAKEFVKHRGLTNVNFICSSIEDFSYHTEPFDLIYSRFLLLHIKDPHSVLCNYRKLIRSSGIIACEEPIVSETKTYPKTDIWHKGQELYMALSKNNGVDADFGLRLLSEIKRAGFKVEQASCAQAIISKQETVDYLMKAYSELKERLIEEKLLLEDEYPMIIANLNSNKYNHIDYGTFHNVAQLTASVS